MNQTFTIKSVLATAINQLQTDEAAIEAQLLLQHLFNVNRAWLIAHENDCLELNIHTEYQSVIERRLKGEPIAYILGYREFYGLKFMVTPDTLIPRPDTETLVEAALAKIPQNRSLQILDLGTGTGAIALAIANNRLQAHVTAVDFSDKALEVASQNAKDLGILNCQFLQSDWLSALKNKRFDVIVSNPPYIEQNDAHLSLGDLPWEPISALVAGQDGLADIRSIISQAKNHLNPNGWLMLEHGYNQAECVTSLLNTAGFDEVSHALDLAGIKRVALGCLV
ncbi:MAG: peptide chain release factor N(5)-glutamine methyltransferase [Methylophilaceae bacterium]